MDTEKASQEWEKIHSGPGKSFHTNVLDHGSTYEPTKQYASLNYVPFEPWNELSFKRNHPFRYRVRQGVKKSSIAAMRRSIGCGTGLHISTILFFIFFYFGGLDIHQIVIHLQNQICMKPVKLMGIYDSI